MLKKAIQIAKATANLSKDPTTKVGASLLYKNQIIEIGYNGMPRGFDDNDHFERDKEKVLSLLKEGKFTFYKYDIFEHAERNLIFNHVKGQLNMENLMIYSTHFPNVEDARAIVSAGIKTVFIESKKEDEAFNSDLHGTLTIFKIFKQSNISLIYLDEMNNSDFVSLEFQNKAKRFLNEFKALDENNQGLCILLRKDFSVVNIQYGLNKAHPLSSMISAIRLSLYTIASNYFTPDYTLVVTMKPCLNCLMAIALSGIKEIVFINNSINVNTNHDKWKEEELSKEYKWLIEEYKLNIRYTEDGEICEALK